MKRAEPGGRNRSPRPNYRTTVIYATLAAVGLLIVAAVAFASRAPKAASDAPIFVALQVGRPAPPFSVTTNRGPFTMPAEDRKPALLEVFATWCPHCQDEVSVMNPLFLRYGDKVDFAAVTGSPYAMDEESPISRADVEKFVRLLKVRYPVAYDPKLAVAQKYLQAGFPTIVVVDRDGQVAAIHVGEISEKTLSKDLDKALQP